MAGRGNGRIRKKRKTGQRLAKVADRVDARARARLEPPLAGQSDLASNNVAGRPLAAWKDSTASGVPAVLKDSATLFEGEANESQSAMAYQELVWDVAPSICVASKEATPTEGATYDTSFSDLKSESAVPDAFQRTKEPTGKALNDLSGEAAARENAHFAPNDMRSRLGAKRAFSHSQMVYDTVGKVSTSSCEAMPPDVDTCPIFGQSNGSGLYVNAVGVPPSVLARWRLWGEAAISATEELSQREGIFALALRSYRDVLLYGRSFVRREGRLDMTSTISSPLAERRMRLLAVSHSLAHVLRARARVLRNDVLISGAKAKDGSCDVELRDQGFSRPRVLFLAPMRNDAYEIVQSVTALAVGTGAGARDIAQISNSDRFEEEFGPGSEDDSAVSAGSSLDPAPNASDVGRPRKPADWEHRFRGNVDDDFKIGISLTKRTVKLYSDFYGSDVIVASPLGLVRALEAKKAGVTEKKRNRSGVDRDKEKAEGEWNAGSNRPVQSRSKNGVGEDDTDCDAGFLSSIEICVIDGGCAFAMQNWSLLVTALGKVNKMPSRQRETDFSRVREWALEGLMDQFRQTVVLSSYKTPEIVSLYRGLENYAGSVRIACGGPADGWMLDVVVPLRQHFLRVEDAPVPDLAPDKRFELFCGRVLSDIRSAVECQALVFVPSYFDFVRIRNKFVALERDDLTFQFVSVSEYSKESAVARAKTRFFTGRAKVLLLTERVHYYWRSHIRGATRIVWYGLPHNSHFYPEIVNYLAESSDRGRIVQSVALFDSLDAFSLERVVGARHSKKMLAKGARSMFLFT